MAILPLVSFYVASSCLYREETGLMLVSGALLWVGVNRSKRKGDDGSSYARDLPGLVYVAEIDESGN